MEKYLDAEKTRNIAASKVFERLLHRAFGPCEVVVAHHITFVLDNEEPNEIPSADTLLFDPAIMGKVFGEKAQTIMLMLARREPQYRERTLADFLDALDAQPQPTLETAHAHA